MIVRTQAYLALVRQYLEAERTLPGHHPERLDLGDRLLVAHSNLSESEKAEVHAILAAPLLW